MGKPSGATATNPSSNPGAVPTRANLKLHELVAPHVESFDYMIDEGLAIAVADLLPQKLTIEGAPALHFWIEDAQIGYPMKDDDSTENRLFPNECRERGLMYSAPLLVTFCKRVGDGGEVDRIQKRVGNVPIMVRSKRCHLANLTPQKLVERREEPNEMGGYFICNGIERCIRLLQLPRRNHVMAIQRGSFANRGTSYSDKAVVIRCVRRDQSGVSVTIHYLQDGNATVRFSVRKQEFLIPVIILLKALKPLTDREIYERTLRGDKDNTYLSDRLEIILRDSKRWGLYTQMECLAYLGSRFRVVIPDIPEDMTDVEVGNLLIDRFIFVHIEKGDQGRAEKVELLLFMLRKLFGFVKGDVAEDRPDVLMNHELLLPGHLYLMFIKEKLEEMLSAVRATILKEYRMDEAKVRGSIGDSSYLRKVIDRQADIGRLLGYLLATGNLKSSSGLDMMQVSGYTIVAEKLNYYRYLSHFRSVHRGQFFTTMKTTSPRKLLPESWGFLCPVHTPDGSPCGLLNHLAAECKVVTRPPFTEDTVREKVDELSKFLVSLGMTPARGHSDGGLILPFNFLTITLDGRILGGAPINVCKDIASTLRMLKVKLLRARAARDLKDNGVVPDMEVCLILPEEGGGGPYPGLFLATAAARLIRPVLQLRSQGVEYIGPMEQVFMEIGCTPEDIYELTTHQELDPTNMLSLIASLTPFSDYNQSPRNMYQCQMGKQTMGTPCHSIPHRTDNKMYRIQTPQAPIVQNRRHAQFQMDDYPSGTNAVVAVISYTGYDMEDAMILNKSSYERGFGHASVYKHLVVDLTDDKRRVGEKPKKYFSNIKPQRGASGAKFTEDLDADGLPEVGTLVEEGDPLYCVYDEVTGSSKIGKHKDHEPAFIDQVRLLGNDAGGQLQKLGIKLRYRRNPIVGDKFSSRHGQKGVMSVLWPQTDMPFSESGMTPDVIINPHAFPSRMTIGMLIESMAAKAGALHGMYQDATPFQWHEKHRAIDYFGEQLRAAGYAYYGSEPLYSGISGTVMHADIYIGVVYYQRLRHMVSDKSQVRATGPVNPLTRQPIKGRKKHGGIRFGEMERDALIGHGTAFLLHDRLMNCSDKHIAHVCSRCGSMLSPVTVRETIATAGQGALTVAEKASRERLTCRRCDRTDTCRAVAMPYVFRFLANELAGMNIKMTLKLKETGC